MSYMLEDHQGSVSSIASKSGTADVNESFSVFGTRRNPTTWSGAPSIADLNTIAGLSRQGYTFQTSLGQSMGLNHMNGRVQDAILGRFLSPDPHIPDPTDAQSYNRESYVQNNPVSLIDPTGFDDCPGNPSSQYAPSGDANVAGCGGGNNGCLSYCVPEITVQCTVNCGPDKPSVPQPTLVSPAVQFQPAAFPPINQGTDSGSQPKPAQKQLPEITVTAQIQTPCMKPQAPRSASDNITDAIVGFGDAFLIPILVRDLTGIGNGTVDTSSSAYKGGEIAGTIEGLIPLALEGAAAYSAAQAARGTPSILNANPLFRIGPGQWGGDMVPRMSSPYLPGGGHVNLSTRLTPIPPLGALASNNGC